MNRELFQQLKKLSTEKKNPRSNNIDSESVRNIIRIINDEDARIAGSVRKELRNITKAVKLVVSGLSHGGRLIYVGAGTSGRLGILDATECPPTFGTSPEKIQGIIAGGPKAVFRSVEGAEDNEAKGRQAITLKKVGKYDVVCGIAASARTPYVLSAIAEAKKRKAKTIFVTTNPRRVLKKASTPGILKSIDVAICADVGPEVVMGSTRMKSGTAQKMILNMITTTAMIRLGKLYGNMMVDLRMTSKKLEERAKRILMNIANVDYTTASETLFKADHHVKTAIVMLKKNISAADARKRLKHAKGFVRKAIE